MDKGRRRVAVVGGGAAGMFGAIACGDEALGESCAVSIIEKSSYLLSKVKISGGGRCNVTHACFDPKQLVEFYPRGGRELLGAFHQFACRDTMDWFEERGVCLKIEEDGRVFPVSNRSQTIIDCLLCEAQRVGVQFFMSRRLRGIEPVRERGFFLHFASGEPMRFDKVLIAVGGIRDPLVRKIIEELGHTVIEPVPSLFSFHIEDPRIDCLAGRSVDWASLSMVGKRFIVEGPILITHTGLSGPGVLKLSSFTAREMHREKYNFRVRINWLGKSTASEVEHELMEMRRRHGKQLVRTGAHLAVPKRLWERFVIAAGISDTTSWTNLSNAKMRGLIEQLTSGEFAVSGKSMNKEEFVTCGGVNLKEIDFKKMESKCCPGLHFAGEVLNIDALTGGFNFQAAWTTGFLAGKAMSE